MYLVRGTRYTSYLVYDTRYTYRVVLHRIELKNITGMCLGSWEEGGWASHTATSTHPEYAWSSRVATNVILIMIIHVRSSRTTSKYDNGRVKHTGSINPSTNPTIKRSIDVNFEQLVRVLIRVSVGLFSVLTRCLVNMQLWIPDRVCVFSPFF